MDKEQELEHEVTRLGYSLWVAVSRLREVDPNYHCYADGAYSEDYIQLAKAVRASGVVRG